MSAKIPFACFHTRLGQSVYFAPHQNRHFNFRVYLRKYVGECLGPKEPGHLFDFITRTCRPVMNCTRVGQIEVRKAKTVTTSIGAKVDCF